MGMNRLETNRRGQHHTFKESVLPREAAPLTILVPTYDRWTDQQGKPGPLSTFLHDLLEARDREGIDFTLIFLDDTPTNKRADIENSLNNAFQNIKQPPRTFLVGIPERDELYKLLDRRLPSNFDHAALDLLIRQQGEGSGSQRFRGDTTVAYDGEKVITLDDDLRLGARKSMRKKWLNRYGIKQIENSFVYVDQSQARQEMTDMVESVAADYLLPFVDVLGKNVEELMRMNQNIIFAEGTINKKDAGVREIIANNGHPTQFVTTHDGNLFTPDPQATIGIATGRKMHIPDVNGYDMSQLYIATGSNGFPISAYPSGEHNLYVTHTNTNPDCAVTGRVMTDERVLNVPWLISNPELSKRHGRIRGTYRAPDRFFSIPPVDGVLTANIPAIFTHDRSSRGFRPDHVTTFWAEDISDVFGDIVLERLELQGNNHRLTYTDVSGHYVVTRDVAGAMYERAQQQITAITEKLCVLQNDTTLHPSHRNEYRENLINMREQLQKQCCGTDFNAFYESLNEELKDQVDFFKKSMALYYPTLETSRDLRREGLYPVAEWVQK